MYVIGLAYFFEDINSTTHHSPDPLAFVYTAIHNNEGFTWFGSQHVSQTVLRYRIYGSSICKAGFLSALGSLPYVRREQLVVAECIRTYTV